MTQMVMPRIMGMSRRAKLCTASCPTPGKP